MRSFGRHAAAVVAITALACSPPPSRAPATAALTPTDRPTRVPGSSASTASTRALPSEPQAPARARPRTVAARLAPGRLEPCAAEAVASAAARPVQVSLGVHLGGCGLRALRDAGPMGWPSPAVGQKVPRLEPIASAEQLQAAAACPPGRKPDADLAQFSHAVLYDVLRSSDHYELVFAVDDGESVTIAVRETRICQGIAPVQHLTATVLVAPGPDRQLVVHRCAPRHPSCGRIP